MLLWTKLSVADIRYNKPLVNLDLIHKMDTPRNQNQIQATRTFIFSLLIMIVVLFFVSKEMDAVKEFIRQTGWLGLVAAVGLYGVLGASVIPSEPLTILISTIAGPLTATIVAGLGNLLAAAVEYYLGAKFGDAANFEEKKAHLPFGLANLPVRSPVFLLVARSIPGPGPKLVSFLSGIYRVPLGLYIWTTAVATFLGAAGFAYGGFELFAWVKQHLP